MKLSPGRLRPTYSLVRKFLEIALPGLFIPFLYLSPAKAVPAVSALLSPSYDINAVLDPSGSRITGKIKITFLNPGSEPMSSFPVMLYPNRFLNQPAGLPADAFSKSFPWGFSPGSLTLKNAVDEKGEPLGIEPVESSLGAGVISRILLTNPVAPGGQVSATLEFSTGIPYRIGGFGQFKSVTSLEGGWHPYLPDFLKGAWAFNRPPPKARFEVELTYPKEVELNHTGRMVSKTFGGPEKSVELRADSAEFFTLILSSRYRDLMRETGTGHAVFLSYFSGDAKYAEKVVGTAVSALQFFEEEYGPSPSPVLRLSEAFLYEDLIAEGGDILLVSHNLYKNFSSLKTYHDGRLLRGLFGQIWRNQIPWAEDWVIEMLSDYTTQAYFYKKQNHPPRGLDTFLKPFSFIPVVDEMLYSRNTSFRQIYLKEGKPSPFREAVRLYNTPRMEGSGILFKLGNLLGKEETSDIVTAYLNLVRIGGKPSFSWLAGFLTGKDLDPFFNQWIDSYPEPDFSINAIHYEHAGPVQSAIVSVQKKGPGVEPLTVRAIYGDGATLDETMDGAAPSKTVIFKSTKPLKAVELDPDHETNDPDLSNNRVPARWKFLLDKFSGAFDLQSRNPALEFGGSLRRVYDSRDVFSLYYFKNLLSSGVRGDYTHEFRHKPSDFFSQSIETNYRLESTQDPSLEPENRGIIGLNYWIGHSGAQLGLGANQQFTGPDHPNNVSAILYLTREIKWAPYHGITLKSQMGESSGPLNQPFLIGGGNGLRGYTQAAVTGSTRAIFSADYFFPLNLDLDFNARGVMLFHTLQGALFADTGNVSEERNLFLFDKYKGDIGAGISFGLDVLGAYPTSVGFQMAWPINAPIPEENFIHYYFTVGIHIF